MKTFINNLYFKIMITVSPSIKLGKQPKSTHERSTLKNAKSAFKQTLKRELGANYKQIHRQNVTTHILTH